MRVLGVVPARGGSKGVPRKNLKLLGGVPLLQYTAEAALRAKTLDRVVLTTDDPEIANVGRELGLDVPFMRPPELAGDDTPMLEVIRHVVTSIESATEPFDAICLLQPTTPFRSVATIDDCVSLLFATGGDSVVTVVRIPAECHPFWAYIRQPDGTLRLATGADTPVVRRQLLPPAFHRDGSVYVTRADVLRAGSLYGERVIGHELPADGLVNIDEPADWDRAEFLLHERSQRS